MESTDEGEISVIITEDGQYNLIGVNQSGAENVTDLAESAEVFMQQGEDGVEVVYIVQPEVGDENVTYAVQDVDGSGEMRFVDENGAIIHPSQVNMVNTGDGTSLEMITDEPVTQSVMPDEAGDRSQENVDEEEEVNILLFCQYCGENLQTLDDLRIHLKQEHDVDDELQSDSEDGDDVTVSLFPSCPDCGSTFMDEEDLKVHKTKCGLVKEELDQEIVEDEQYFVKETMKEEFGFGGHKCQLCAEEFEVRNDLDIHIEEIHHSSAYGPGDIAGMGVQSMYHKCPYCPRMYMSKWHKKSLIKHIKDEHPNEAWDVPFKLVEVKNTGLFRRLNAKKGGYQSCFPCIYCNRKFLWQKSLARHYKDYHQDRLDTLEEEEVTELLGKKHNRSVTVPGDEANVSCDKCGKQFKWEKSLKRHSLECDKLKARSDGYLMKCLYCSLVSKYTCSLRKHMKRFHSEEVAGLNINDIDIPVVDMATYGHNVLSIDKRPADERLKDCPIVFKCKYCDYVTPGQSNLKRHLMSIKHNYTDEQLREIKLSSFKVYQKPKRRSVGRPRKVKEEVESISDSGGENKHVEDDVEDHSGVIENSEQRDEEAVAEIHACVKTDGTIGDPVDEGSDVHTDEIPLDQEITPNKATNETSRGSINKVVKANRGTINKVVKAPKNNSIKKVTKDSEKLLPEADSVFCLICNKQFVEFSSFIHHCQIHCNIKIDFMCSHCTESFPMFESLRKHHSKTHTGLTFTGTRMKNVSLVEVKSRQGKMKAFECPYCDLILSQSGPLRQHISEEHMDNVLDVSIKTEPSESHLKSLGGNIISGLSCGFCECKYNTLEDMVNHMQIIHPFVDKSTLGQGSSDSGSVRKSGRKRKIKYPGFDEEEPTSNATKKQKLDFKSPVTSRKIKGLEASSKIVKSTTSSISAANLSVSGEDITANETIDITDKEGSKEDDAEVGKKRQEEKTLEISAGSLISSTIQPVVNLGLKVDSPKIKEATIVRQNTDAADSPQPQGEPIVRQGKKRGRKRKEDKVVQQDSAEKPIVNQRNIDSSVASENKCPHCNFSCKRSSALTFHINFNHMKIKEEPIDPDTDMNKSEDKTPSRKRNSYGSMTKRQATPIITEDVAHGNKTLERGMDKGNQNKGKTADKKKKIKTAATTKKKKTVDDDFYDEEEDLEIFDDSDADQDYKPSADDAAVNGDDDDEIEASEYTENSNFSVPVENIPHLHKCVYCSKKYNSREKVINHVKAAHQNLTSAKVKMSPGGKVTAIIDSQTTKVIKQKISSMYKCSVCNFLCRTEKGLKKHVSRLHTASKDATSYTTEIDMDAEISNSFQCPYCRYKTYYKSSINRHVKKMHPMLMENFNADNSCVIVPNEDREREKREKVPGNGTFSCPYCGIINKWKKSIVRHIRVAHPEESQDVDIDPVNLPEIKNVEEKYERLNIGFKKKLQCLHCSFSCKILTHMTKHIENIHHFGGVMNSDIERQADYQYVYEKQAGIDEMQPWTDDGQQEKGIHNCPFCGLTYGWKKSLGLHVKKAHPDMPEVFDTMEKMLTIVAKCAGPEKLKRGYGQKCNQCGVVFNSDGALGRHEILKHSGKPRTVRKLSLPRYVNSWQQKNYRLDSRYRLMMCKQCGTCCKSLLSLKTHTRIYHHQELLECLYTHCHTWFRWKGCRKNHLQEEHQHQSGLTLEKMDTNKCEMCDKVFISSQELRDHVTEFHLLKKAKRRPFVYKCTACDSTFDSANMRDHHFSTAHIELTEMCDICGGVFTNKKQLQQHVKRHEKNPGDSTTVCDHCGMTMGKKSLKKHLLFKHPQKLVCTCGICSGVTTKVSSTVKCDLCNQPFCQKMYLYAHKRLSHNIKDRVYKCKICKSSFASQKLRNVHLHEQHLSGRSARTEEVVDNSQMDIWPAESDNDRTTHVIHVGQDKGAQYLPKLSESSLGAVIKELMIISSDKNNYKPFKCLLCGRAFGKSKYIKLHIRRNHVKDEDKPYRCKVCGSGFVRLTEFRKHSRSHSGFRPYKCRMCNKAFKQQANLIDHMHIHKDSKDFQCFICKRHFQQRGGMTSHILTHDTLKPFKCMFCEKGFTSRGELSRHMQKYSSQMAESKSFLCHICHTSFTHYPLLIRHIETHNPDKPFPCEACGLKFASFMSLYNHKLKMKHFLLSDIQIGEEGVDSGKTNPDTQEAVDLLEMDLYENVQSVHQDQVEEETIYVAQDGSFIRDNPEMGKTTIIIEPMEAEEIVQTSHKLHDNEELLSIAKQLTELSTYTENDNIIEFSVIHDEDEIMKDMLDADTEILASIEKQSVKPKAVLEPKQRKVPETLEEILHIQQVEQQEHLEAFKEEEETFKEEEEDMHDHQDNNEVVKEEVVENVAETNADQESIVNEIVTTSAEIPTNMEELAALIAQSSQGLEDTDGITAYETEDGVIYVCMPDNVDSNSYEEVLNSAVQSITGENVEGNQGVLDENKQGEGEIYSDMSPDENIVHVNINDVPDVEKTDEEYMKLSVSHQVDEQTNIDILEQDKLNVYGENGVVEIVNDERTFIKQELLDDSYGFGNSSSKFTLENGVFTYQTCKLRYHISGRTFKCLECGKCSKSKKRLKDHLKRHIPVESRENACMYCPSRFVTGNELARHLAVHTDDRRYKCSHCPKSFRQPGHLTEHQLIHQNLRPHSCTQCFQSFRTKRQLIVHAERKHSLSYYECDECNTVLNSKVGLIIHKGSVHSSNFKSARRVKKDPKGEEGGEYQCEKCGAAFATGLRLKNHIKTHGENFVVESKSFMCEVCGGMYHSKDYLKEHILKVHTDVASEICDQCGEAFKTVRLLQIHKRRVHSLGRRNTPIVKKSHVCKVCQKKFSTRHALAYHIGVTPSCKNVSA